MLGHKNIQPTQHYARVLDKKVSEDIQIHTHLHHATIRGDSVRPDTRINTIRNFQTTTTHHFYYATGPTFEEVQRDTRTKIDPIRIETCNRAPNLAGCVYLVPLLKLRKYNKRRTAKPRPSIYRNADQPRQNNTNPNPTPDTQRRTQRENIRSLPQEHRTSRR